MVGLAREPSGTDNGYRELIAQLAANYIAHTGNRDQVFATVTDTYHLELTTVEDRNIGPTPALILMARPLAQTRQEGEDLKHAILEALCGRSGNHFYVGTQKVRVVDESNPRSPVTLDCKLCKSETHRTADCPLPKSRGWRGIMPSLLGLGDKSDATTTGAAQKEDKRALLDGVFGTLKAGSRATSQGQKARPYGQASSGDKRGRGRGGAKGGRGRGFARA